MWSRSMLVITAQSASNDVDGVQPPAQADFEDHEVELRRAPAGA